MLAEEHAEPNKLTKPLPSRALCDRLRLLCQDKLLAHLVDEL